jgi:predicted transcriptional regulator YdeE
MENYVLENDITVFCITATSFPAGVMAAHKELHSLVPFSTERKYFGISRANEKGEIIYKAAAEELIKGELEKHGLEKVVLKKGNYLSAEIHDYMKDLPSIGKTFQEMISQPTIDPQGWCVEWYLSQEDVRCMVRLK